MSDKPNTPETDASAHALTIEHGIALLEPHPNGRWAPIEVARRLEVSRDEAIKRYYLIQDQATQSAIEADHLRVQLRAEVERLTNENTLLSEGPAAAGWWSPATVKAYEKDHAALRAQLAAAQTEIKTLQDAFKDRVYCIEMQTAQKENLAGALKVAKEALKLLGNDDNHLEPTFSPSEFAGLALRRIEELTKEKQPHE